MTALTRRLEPIGAGVPYDVFIGLIWATLALATIFVGVRLLSRVKTHRRLFWDDAFVIFAFILAVTTAALWQWQAPVMYWILDVDAGKATATADIFDKQILWLKVSLVVEIFFYTSLTAVKLSFLFFFRRLGEKVRNFKLYWWPITAFVLAVWFVCLGNIQYHCEIGSPEQLNTGYCASQAGSDFTSITLKVNAALDVLSDFSIMLIPVVLVWNVHMRSRKKLALIGLFSLSLVTMSVAIARAADLSATMWTNGIHDPTYLWLWSAIEPCIAILVSCLSAFPQLFSSSKRASKHAFKPTDTYYQRLAYWRKMRSTKPSEGQSLDDLNAQPQSKHMITVGSSDVELGLNQEIVHGLVPGGFEPLTVCYKGLNHAQSRSSVRPHGQIVHEREYQVTSQYV